MASSHARVDVLGGLRATGLGDARTQTQFRTRHVAGLLGYVACHPSTPIPRETLMDVFWPGADPALSRARLSQALSSARMVLEPLPSDRGACLVADRTNVACTERLTTDLGEVLTALADAQTASGGENRHQALARAVSAYGGSLLPDRYEDWVLERRRELTGHILRALDELGAASAKRGDLDEALGFASRASSLDPFDEPAVAVHLRLLIQAGRGPEASTRYQEFADRLARELDVAPSAETAAIVQQDVGRPPSPTGPNWSERHTLALARIDLPTAEGQAAFAEEMAAAGPRFHVEYASPSVALLAGLSPGNTVERLTSFRARNGGADGAIAITLGEGSVSEGRLTSNALDVLELLHAQTQPGHTTASSLLASLLGSQGGPVPAGTLNAGNVTEISVVALHQLSADGEPALRSSARSVTSVPHIRDGFFGRDEDIAAAKAVIDSGFSPLTVTGIGGTGKTRFACEVARQPDLSWPAGARFVGLEAVRQPKHVAREVCRQLSLSVPRNHAPLDVLRDAFGEQSGLLILDNVEQLLPHGASVIQEIVAALPGAIVMVTSRVPVGVPGERVLRLKPLRLPSLDENPDALRANPAVRLFVTRATGCAPEFQVSDDNVTDVARLVRHVDGVPLALELAAARAAVMGPAEIVDRVSTRAALDEVIEWSFKLLSEPARKLLTALSVFRGTFTLPAVEAVSIDPLTGDYLAELVDSSLVEPLVETPPRFRLLETVREFAAHRLTHARRLRVGHRHAAAYTEFAAEQSEFFNSDRTKQATAVMVREAPNLRAAVDFLLDEATAGRTARARLDARVRGIELVDAHCEFLSVQREAADAVEMLRGFVDASEALPDRTMAIASFQLGSFYGQLARYEDGERELLRAIERFEAMGDHGLAGRCQLHLGAGYVEQGQLDDAHPRLTAALAYFQGGDDERAEAQALHNLGNLFMARNERGEALTHYEQALAIKRRRRAERDLASSLLGVANVAELNGEIDKAVAYAREGIDVAEEIGDFGLAAVLRSSLGAMEARRGNLEDGMQHLVDSYRHLVDVGLDKNAAMGLFLILSVPGIEQFARWALPVFGAALAAFERMGVTFAEHEQQAIDEIRDTLTAGLPLEEVNALLADGRVRSLADIVDHLESRRP